MKRKLSKAIALVLVLTTALSLMTVAGAATVKYAKTEVNVRSGPGTNYTVLGYLEKGDAVTATGTVVGNWTQIQFSKYELGYVSSAYLTSSNSSSSSQACPPSGAKFKVCSDCGDIYYATTDLNVRSGPGTKYSIVGALAKNQQVTRVGKSGNWYKLLTTDGSTAYASASYLKLYKTGSAPAEKEETTQACGYYYATTGLNVRKGPGTSYKVVDELNKGDRVAYLGKSGNWYKVRTARGIVGYCYKSYMSAAAVKPAKPVNGYYCNQCGVVVCTENGCYTNGGVCYQDKYYCGSCYNFNWSCSTPVYGNVCNTLYAGETYRTRYGIVLYSAPSTSSPVTHTLLTGTKVTLLSGTSNANWVRVKVNECGCYGYLPAKSIG